MLEIGTSKMRQTQDTDRRRDSGIPEDLQYKIIERYFDTAFYVSITPILRVTNEDPIIHFLRIGYKEGRDPNSEFSTKYYLNEYPDVAAAAINPFVHYVAWGRAEGRNAKLRQRQHGTVLAVHSNSQSVKQSADCLLIDELEEQKNLIRSEFDERFYRTQLPKSAKPITDQLGHYLTKGWREGLDPSPNFSTQLYLEYNEDVKRAGINPFFHYVGWGRAEGRSGNPQTIAARKLISAANLEHLSGEEQTKALSALRGAFDAPYYLSVSPDLQNTNIDLFSHYMIHGWREHRDPSPNFSTAYYLESNPDLRSGANPFSHYILHGRREGRKAQTFAARLRSLEFEPNVTIIVPNYNHARFLAERIESIIKQTYQNFNVILLDDCSTDGSNEIIDSYCDQYPDKIRKIINAKNSGSVFSQWRRGIEAADGDLVWICESDDFCELTFLEKCIQPFRDSSVMISFARVQFANKSGSIVDGLDYYREQAEPGVWNNSFIRSAAQWFRGAFASANIIPNVGGCLIRRAGVPDHVWNEAITYKISGDWYLYIEFAQGGRIAYCHEAVAYFRQHDKNTSVSGFVKPYYYSEHERIICELRKRWGTPDDIAVKLYAQLYRQFVYVKGTRVLGNLSEYYSNDRVLQTRKSNIHVLMSFLGFQPGGGEIFPIHLSNALLKLGYTVSALCLDTDNQESGVRRMLDPRIPVYDAQLAIESGDINEFIESVGADLIHTHNAGIEFLFFNKARLSLSIPYIVTLHGSYEVTPIPDDMMYRVLRGVSHWVYLSQKNIEHLGELPISESCLSFIPNGMPLDERPFQLSKEMLGIGADDITFLVASRAIPEKGWGIAIGAFQLAQSKTSRRLHLLLCGTGPQAGELQTQFGSHAQIHFLGFQDRISGAYKLADVAMLPTRFRGESYPLTLIQALQVGCPIISTDVGEIRHMLRQGEMLAGLTVSWIDDDKAFSEEVAGAMVRMLDDATRLKFGADAQIIGKSYAIDHVAQHYSSLYQNCMVRTGHRSQLARIRSNGEVA